MDSITMLTTALANIDAKILEISANPKPNYSIEGQSIQWSSFFNDLMTQRQKLSELLVIAQGPGEFVVEGVT